MASRPSGRFKKKPRFRVRVGRQKLMTITEALYEVVIQVGSRQDDDRDWLVALCFRKCDADTIARGLALLAKNRSTKLADLKEPKP